ncbi:MAG: DUF4920 domain-containing protein [Myxococcota bacterium]
MRSSHLTILLGAALLALGACDKAPGSEATPESVEPATVAAAATAEGAPAGEAPKACCDGAAKAAAAAEGGATAAAEGEAPKACCDGAAKAAAAGDQAKAGCGNCAGNCEGCKGDCAGGCDNCAGGEKCSCEGCKGKAEGKADGACCGGKAEGKADGACCGGKDKAACAGGSCAGGEGDCPFADANKPALAAVSGGEAAPGCPHAAAAAAAAAAPAGSVDVPAGEQHFGSPFALAEAKPLASLLATEPAPANDSVVQLSGVIDQVCKKKGCWLVVRDGDKTARITMKDYAFVVPLDSQGKQVVVEGTLGVRTFNEAQVKHLESDRGGNPDDVSGTRTEVVVKASGVRIRG